MQKFLKEYWELLLTLIVIVGTIMFMCCGCRGANQIEREVPVYIHDTVREVHNDTVRQSDTTIVERNTIVQVADSATLARLEAMGLMLDKNKQYILVLQTELNQRISELATVRSDSSYKHDETPVPVSTTETKIVEKKVFVWWPCIVLMCIAAVLGLLWWLVEHTFNNLAKKEGE